MKAGWIGFPKGEGDFWETVEMYAKIGYRGTEGAETLLNAGNVDDNVRRFYDLGLEVLTVSTSVDDLKKDVESVIKKAKIMRANRATIWASSVLGFWHKEQPSKDVFFEEIEIMEKAAEALAKEDIKLCFHNHNAEFQMCYDGLNVTDQMMNMTRYLCLELDVGWVDCAGFDPVAVLRKYADRIAAVHMKDYIPKESVRYSDDIMMTIPTFTSLGTGVVDIKGILECMTVLGMDWVVYEQDTVRNLNDTESMTQSYLYMKETGLVE